jgi:hypothetical protein
MGTSLTLGLFEQLYPVCHKSALGRAAVYWCWLRRRKCVICVTLTLLKNTNYVWHGNTTVISRQYKLEFSELYSLQVYYTAYSDNSVPTFWNRITTVSCVVSQKSEDLMYVTAEAWENKKFSDFCFSLRYLLLFLVNFSTRCWQRFCDDGVRTYTWRWHVRRFILIWSCKCCDQVLCLWHREFVTRFATRVVNCIFEVVIL